MGWIDVNKRKPNSDQAFVLVMNSKWNFTKVYLAIYHKEEDVFLRYDEERFLYTPLDVTHWIEIPEFNPKEN